MILETVRIIADWLADPTYGVNALAASVPMDTGVTQAPDVVVLNSTESGATARGQIPDVDATLPALLVTPADQPVDQVSPAVQPYPADATLTVLVRYATKKNDTAAAERDASQTLRAVARSLRSLTTTSAGEAARSRSSVQLIYIASTQIATLYEDNKDVIVTGGMLVTCRVKDLWTQA